MTWEWNVSRSNEDVSEQVIGVSPLTQITEKQEGSCEGDDYSDNDNKSSNHFAVRRSSIKNAQRNSSIILYSRLPLQHRLEEVWKKLEMPYSLKLQMLEKYAQQEDPNALFAAVDKWETAAEFVALREKLCLVCPRFRNRCFIMFNIVFTVRCKPNSVKAITK